MVCKGGKDGFGLLRSGIMNVPLNYKRQAPNFKQIPNNNTQISNGKKPMIWNL
jgi:hypothetical protein